jgi:hypothetical protein
MDKVRHQNVVFDEFKVVLDTFREVTTWLASELRTGANKLDKLIDLFKSVNKV